MNLDHLQTVALRWLRTPFSANACVPGLDGGVSCQGLAAAICVEVGVLPVGTTVPAGRVTRGRFCRESEIAPWLDGRAEFRRLADSELAEPGDLCGFEIGWCLNHLGVLLPDHQFIHCLEGLGVHVSSILDATWASRLKVIWRPVS